LIIIISIIKKGWTMLKESVREMMKICLCTNGREAFMNVFVDCWSKYVRKRLNISLMLFYYIDAIAFLL